MEEATADPAASNHPDPRAVPRHGGRALLMSCYLVALGIQWRLIGPPTRPVPIFLWLWAAEIAWNPTAPWRSHLRFVRDWGGLLLLLVAYTDSYRLVTVLGMPVHVRPPIRFDGALFGGTLPTLWLQRHLCGNPCTAADPAHWYDLLAAVVYSSHFVLSLSIAALLWLFARSDFGRFMTRYLALTALGLAVYVLYPMAPPWWATGHGMLPHVARITDRGWDLVQLDFADAIISKGQAMSDPVAAMPSMHAATALFVAWVLIGRLRRRWRFLLLLYPAVMGGALIYLGEHYLLDVLSGFATTAVVMTAVAGVERWRVLRRIGRASPLRLVLTTGLTRR